MCLMTRRTEYRTTSLVITTGLPRALALAGKPCSGDSYCGDCQYISLQQHAEYIIQ